MSQPIFATDVDSVLLDITTPIVNHFAMKHPKAEVYKDGWHTWSIETAFGVPPEEVEEMWGYIFSERTLPEPGAEEFVWALKNRGYRVVAVTARIPKFQSMLMRDIAHMELDDVIFCRDKEETLAGLAPEAFIDDKIQHLHEAARAGVPRRFLLNQPWNFSLDLNAPYKRIEFHDEALPALELAIHV